mgnify:CR=1 FL=1
MMIQDVKIYLAIFLKRTDSLIYYFNRSIKFIVLTEALIYYFNRSIFSMSSFVIPASRSCLRYRSNRAFASISMILVSASTFFIVALSRHNFDSTFSPAHLPPSHGQKCPYVFVWPPTPCIFDQRQTVLA